MKEWIGKIRQRRLTIPRNVTLDNQSIIDKKDIDEKLNKFFTKIAPSLDNKIVPYFETFEKSDTALSNGSLPINKLKDVFYLGKNKGLEANEITYNVTKNCFTGLLMF